MLGTGFVPGSEIMLSSEGTELNGFSWADDEGAFIMEFYVPGEMGPGTYVFEISHGAEVFHQSVTIVAGELD